MLGNLRVSQGVGFLSVVLGILIFSILYKKYKASHPKDDGGYKPVYEGADGEPQNTENTDKTEITEEPEGEQSDGGENH